MSKAFPSSTVIKTALLVDFFIGESWAEGPYLVLGKLTTCFCSGFYPRERGRFLDWFLFPANLPEAPPTGLWAGIRGSTPPGPARGYFWRISLALPRPSPRAPPPRRPAGETRESLGPQAGGRVAGLRRLSRCRSPLCLPLSEGPFPRRLGDAGEPAAEGPLRERASSRTRHGAGEWRGLGPQPRRTRPAGEAAALLSLVKGDPWGGCREGRTPPVSGAGGSFQTSGLLFPSCSPPASRVSSCPGIWCELSPPWPPLTSFLGGFPAFSCVNPN